MFLVLAGQAAAVEPVKGDVSDSTKDLEEMFSGDHSSSEIYQLYGGQARPIQPGIPTSTSYDVPYQDYFNNFAVFGDFLGLFEDGNLTPPQINSTWRQSYLDSIAATAPSAKGRMTQAGKSRLLKPLLIDEPEF